ncbi:hypothetical protein C8J57DRAFT_1432304 [Mycena rebaudengoi]|nr:hypothetical protein C8J57DRAFT_1432304 [Mycena rebaudengoi]
MVITSSTEASSSSAPAVASESRPQAGPLPQKRGEIGFSEELLQQAEEGRSTTPTTALPERHPEDRSAPEATAPAPSGHCCKRICGAKYKGFHLGTLITFAFQCLLMVGTIVGWYFAATRLSHVGSSSSTPPVPPHAIFIHVVFTVITIVQLLFLERRIFRLRAERYSYVHPGEILPRDPSIGFSPWNRPPLPTYAAALAQSGVGTGDVEDHLIAAPPPPAYGNTRGSTFLLSGFLRESLRAQRPASTQTQASQRNMIETGERPLSYVSVDEQWEEVQNAERARRLEETLSTLERPAASASR